MKATETYTTGFRVDDEQAFLKSIKHEFPIDGIGNELIQNMTDPYDLNNMQKQIIIKTSNREKSLELVNNGRAFNNSDLDAILTLGLSTKSGVNTRGKWGVGFYSSFNPELGINKIELRTNLNNIPVLITFLPQHNKKPVILSKELTKRFIYSTSMKFFFKGHYYMDFVMQSLRKSMKYLNDIDATINGKTYSTIWDLVKQNNLKIYSDNVHACYIERNHYNSGNDEKLEILCKYQHVNTRYNLASFLTGGRDTKFNLTDYDISYRYWCTRSKFPYVGDVNIVCNCDILNLTISRDSYYLDSSWVGMIDFLKKALIDYLFFNRHELERDIILNNIYIFRNEIKAYLFDESSHAKLSEKEKLFVEFLAGQPLFELFGKNFYYSLIDLKKKFSTESMPTFYTSNSKQLWLCGAFRNDFVLVSKKMLSHPCQKFDGFIEEILSIIKNPGTRIINIDTIGFNNSALKYLVDNGFVLEEQINPKLSFKGFFTSKEIDEFQKKFRQFLNENPGIIIALEKFLQLNIGKLIPAFFKIDNNNIHVSSCFLNESGSLAIPGETDEFIEREEDLVLGLCIDHPVISMLMKQVHSPEIFTVLLMHTAQHLNENIARLQPLRIVEFNQRQLITELRKAVLS